MMPSATAASWRAWAGFDTPNPTATGTGLTARTSRRKRLTPGGSDVRAPVTPASETRVEEALAARSATKARRSTGVVGATR